MTTEQGTVPNINALLDTKMEEIGRGVIKTDGLAIPHDGTDPTVAKLQLHITAIREAAMSQEGFDIVGHMNALKATLIANPDITAELHEESLGEIVTTLRKIHLTAIIKEAPKKVSRTKRTANAAAKNDDKVLASTNIDELDF